MDKGRDEHRSQEEDEDEDEYTDEHTITFKERKSKYGRRTQVEVLLGFVVHLLMLFYWVFVHVYDASVVKSLSEDARRVAFPTHDQFLGRWRFLTYINMVRGVTVYLRGDCTARHSVKQKVVWRKNCTACSQDCHYTKTKP